MSLVISTKDGKDLTGVNGSAQNGKNVSYGNYVYDLLGGLEIQQKAGSPDTIVLQTGYGEISGIHFSNENTIEKVVDFSNATKNVAIRIDMTGGDPTLVFLTDGELRDDNLVEENVSGVNDLVLARLNAGANNTINNIVDVRVFAPDFNNLASTFYTLQSI